VTPYKWLLARGTPTVLKRTERASPTDLNWLPQELRGAVEAIFAAGQRIPQEALGARVLVTSSIVDL
jgi:hypothetical protein